MYKIVVYWRWDRGTKYADMFWCVRWPDLSNEEFEEHRAVDTITRALQAPEGAAPAASDVELLQSLGYPEAAQLLKDLWPASLRARFNMLERAVYNSPVPLTCEQVERIYA